MPKSSKLFWAPSPSPVKQPAAKSTSQSGATPGLQSYDSSVLEKQNFIVRLPFGSALHVKIAKEFFGCLVISFLLYWLAALVANEWLYLLSGGFLVGSCLGFILPFIQLAGLKPQGAMPHEIVVSESADCLLTLKRAPGWAWLSSFLPLHSLRLTIELVRLSGMHREAEKILSPKPIVIDMPNDELVIHYVTPPLRRGIYRLQTLELSSGFPFGISLWTRKLDVKKNSLGDNLQITVYPLSIPIAGNFLSRLAGLNSYMGLSCATSRLVQQSASVRSVREFQTGDSLRHIHWPTSARLGKLFVREYDAETLPAYNILLDLKADWQTEKQFDLAVVLTLSLIELGHQVGTIPHLLLNPPLDSPQLKELMSDLPQIPPGLEYICEVLARVEPMNVSESRETQSSLKTIVENNLQGRPLLAVVPSSEKILVYSAQKGDQVVSPVELVSITGISEQLIIVPAANDRKVQFKLARQPVEQNKQSTSNWSINKEVLAVISSEREFGVL